MYSCSMFLCVRMYCMSVCGRARESVHVCLYVCVSQRQRESVFVYNNVCVRLGVLIHTVGLTCAIVQEKRQGQGPVASAARRFPSYIPSSH